MKSLRIPLVLMSWFLLLGCSPDARDSAEASTGLAIVGGGHLSLPDLDESSLAVVPAKDGRNILYYCAVRNGKPGAWRATRLKDDLYEVPVALTNESLVNAVSVTATMLPDGELAAIGLTGGGIRLYRHGHEAVTISSEGTVLSGQPIAILPPDATLGPVTVGSNEIGLVVNPAKTRNLVLARLSRKAIDLWQETIPALEVRSLTTLPSDIAPGGSYVQHRFLGQNGGLLLYARTSARGDHDIHAGNCAGFEIRLERISSDRDDVSPCLVPQDQSLYMASRAFAPQHTSVSFNLFRWSLEDTGIGPVGLPSSSHSATSLSASVAPSSASQSSSALASSSATNSQSSSSEGSSSSTGPQFFTVTYVAVSAESGFAPADPNTYAPGATVTVTNDMSGELYRSGFVLIGWYDETTQKLYQPEDGTLDSTFTMPARNVTLVSKWMRLHLVGSDPMNSYVINDANQEMNNGAGWNAFLYDAGIPYLAGAGSTSEAEVIFRINLNTVYHNATFISHSPTGMSLYGGTLALATYKWQNADQTRTVGYYEIDSSAVPNSETSFTNYISLASNNTPGNTLTNTGIWRDASGTWVAGRSAAGIACYWDAARTMNELPSGNTGLARAIVRDGSDTYIAGSGVNADYIWKNGSILYTYPGATINAITVANGIVYAVGKAGSEPAYWKNNTQYLLDGTVGEATAICVKNGVMYIGGHLEQEGYYSVYWIDGGSYKAPSIKVGRVNGIHVEE
ncbi:MAG TPA: hypothetical protein PLM00_00765 [Spirochaetota bacterium]|nr:hypothetical protein [Spirochaetota bacterium]HPN81890.1 hypothetical protein [Spirochaetota bacterium]